MADNNKNPRRTIWLSETEPLSHYDVWLSKNQHLNSDGEPLSDSGVLRPCDYIFKIWDCDNWYPVVGLNSTAVNKIDTVLNTGYTTTHNGNTINSFSYEEFHLPLFTKTTSSPSELFDAGTIGNAVLEYVTELEWLNIFEGYAFSNSFKLYFPTIIHNGGISINQLLEPAEADKLGGIWADEFSIENMFPDTEAHNAHSQTEINDSYNWIALAKYKLNHGTSDYNLYVNAKDIIKIVTEYQEDNPNEPGITPGGGAIISPEVLYNSFYNSPTVLKGWRDNNPNLAWKPRFEIAGATLQENRGKFLKLRDDEWWNTNTNPYSAENNAIEWVNIDDYLSSAINNNNLIRGGNGIAVSQVNEHDSQHTSIGLAHIQQAQDGAICRKITSNDLSDIEWTLLDNIYPLLTVDSSSDIRYVVKGGSDDKHYLNGNGEWTVPTGTDYTNGSFISINQGVIDIAPYSYNGSYYLSSNDGYLSWTSAPEQTTFIQGTGIKIENTNPNEKTISVNTLGGNAGDVLSIIDADTVGWRTIPSGTPTTYTGDIGITVDDTDDTIKINIGTDNNNKYLRVNEDGDDVEWATVQPEYYTEGVGIDITNNKISSEISINSNVISASSSLGFNCVLGTSSNPIGNVTVSVDLGTPVVLAPFSYTKINLDTNGGSGTISFVVFNQKDIMNGDPVFIELILDGTIDVSIVDDNLNGYSYIDSNGALQGNGFKAHHVLVTIQFGIVKFEAIELYSSI